LQWQGKVLMIETCKAALAAGAYRSSRVTSSANP
jgi:hypothetical protein